MAGIWWRRHWTGERSALEVSKHLLARERERLGGAGDDVLEFAGLLDRRPESDAERGQVTLTIG